MPLQRPCVSKLGNVTGVKWLALALPQKSFHVICDGFRHEIRRWSPRNGPKYSPKLVFRHPKWSRSTYGNPISGLLVSPFWSHQVPTGCQKGPKRAQHKGRSPLNCHFLENVVFHPFLGPGQMGPQTDKHQMDWASGGFSWAKTSPTCPSPDGCSTIPEGPELL